MKPPQLKPGQFSGLLIQSSTGIVLNRDGSVLCRGTDKDFFILDSLAQAHSLARELIDSGRDREFAIWDDAGVAVETIAPSK